jgi:lysophospholipase L1-like esterase
MRPLLPTVLFAALSNLAAAADVLNDRGLMRFDFVNGGHAPDEIWTPVANDIVYSDTTGYGYDNEARSADKPYRFSLRVPDGNYRVTVQLGDATADSVTTVKSEQRRLELERVTVPAGRIVTRSFTVNVRTPKIAGGGEVKLGERELGRRHWDDKLSLEFSGKHPALANIEIERVDNATTIFLAGDSTVTDQGDEPFAGWGQLLPRFVRSDVAVANYAESGRSLTSFANERRLEKILSVAKPGDYLFIQFGHNDMKEKFEGAGAYGNYTTNLKTFIAKAREKQMTPVLVTPMHRRRFDEAGHVQNSFGDYPEAMRKVAVDEHVALIDLMAMSLKFYEALGVEGSKKAFVHYPANTFPGQAEALKDDTHHSTYGGYELARCVVEGMRTTPLLANLLSADVVPFDPSKPDVDLAE